MWDIDFITQANFQKHVKETIKKYDEKLLPCNIQKFNLNTIDPIKLIFDKTVYDFSWAEIINNEIFRQRDKSNNNDIGYFHQRLFAYIKNCVVPDEGWDVIYSDDKGINLPDNQTVSKIYVELKNKHNTMNSASAGKTYIKMQHQLLSDDDSACFLVEAIAKTSQNITWKTTVDKKTVSHKRIRRISLDQFYALVTKDEHAFYKICMALPDTIKKVLQESKDINQPNDTVFMELEKKAHDEKISFEMAIYLLGFKDYLGFHK